MRLRALTTSDSQRLRQLFAEQGFEYDLPDVRMLVAAQGIEDDSGLVQAVLARPTVELYFLGDGKWKTPAQRFEALRILHESMRRDLAAKGFSDAHVWIPPQKKSFVRRLMKTFGWTLPVWTNLTRSTRK